MKSYAHLVPAGISRIRISECEESAPYEHEGQFVRTVAYVSCLLNNPFYIHNGRIAEDMNGGYHFVVPNNKLNNGSRIDNIRSLNDEMKKEMERDIIDAFKSQTSHTPSVVEPEPAKKSLRDGRKTTNVTLSLSEEEFRELEEAMEEEGRTVHRKSFPQFIKEQIGYGKKKK